MNFLSGSSLTRIRLGTVTALDLTQARCRIQMGALITDWLPWLVPCAGAVRTWQPPSLGEQVLVLSPQSDQTTGFVLRGLYSQDAPAPSHSPDEHTTIYPDGARITYDSATHSLSLAGLSQITIDCSNIVIRGSLSVEGELSSNGITLHTHQHGGVKGGGDLSGGPQ